MATHRATVRYSDGAELTLDVRIAASVPEHQIADLVEDAVYDQIEDDDVEIVSVREVAR